MKIGPDSWPAVLVGIDPAEGTPHGWTWAEGLGSLAPGTVVLSAQRVSSGAR